MIDPGDDPLGVRADFPVTARGVYLNSAYITPNPLPVLEVGRRFIETKANEPIQLEEMLEESDRVRQSVARLFGAKANEIGFIGATSEGENILARALDLGADDNVVVDALHYDATYHLYRHLADTRGVELRVAPHKNGRVDPIEIEALVDNRTRVVSVAWVAHQNGFRHDLRSISEVAHSKGALFYVDAIQGAGTLALDVREEGVDVLSAGTFKWMLGGYGTAAFFVKEELLHQVPHDRFGGMHVESRSADGAFHQFESAKKYEYASLAFGAVYQLGAGVDYLERIGVPAIEAHTVSLAQYLSRGLSEQGFSVLTPEGNRSSIVAFVTGVDPVGAARDLDAAAVQVTFREDGSQIRVGAALFNNKADVDALLAVTANWTETTAS